MARRKQFFLILWLVQILAISGCAGNLPTNPGQLAPCPGSPNCVSTQSTDENHAIDPIPYSGKKDEAKKRLLQIIHSLPGSQVVVDNEDHLHVKFTSRIFRFVDDIEFYLGMEDAMIHFRSASRLGYSDFGANRKRMEDIRSLFISSDLPSNHKP